MCTQLEEARWRQLAAWKSPLEVRQEASLGGPQALEGELRAGLSEGPGGGVCTSLPPVLAAAWPTGQGLWEVVGSLDAPALYSAGLPGGVLRVKGPGSGHVRGGPDWAQEMGPPRRWQTEKP